MTDPASYVFSAQEYTDSRLSSGGVRRGVPTLTWRGIILMARVLFPFPNIDSTLSHVVLAEADEVQPLISVDAAIATPLLLANSFLAITTSLPPLMRVACE